MSECDGEKKTVTIHNVDQRSPIVTLDDARIPGGGLRLEQCGATSAGFVSGTSSVVWGTAPRMARWVLDRPELFRDRRVLELGSGIGLVGAAAAALGAAVVLTDCEGAMPLLARNQCLLAAQGFPVLVSKLDWGSSVDEETVRSVAGVGNDGFDVLLACDVILSGWDTDKLLETCGRLLKRDSTSCFLLGFEFREDWETISLFLERALDEFGLDHRFVTLRENGSEAEEDDDEEIFVYSFFRSVRTESGGLKH